MSNVRCFIAFHYSNTNTVLLNMFYKGFLLYICRN